MERVSLPSSNRPTEPLPVGASDCHTHIFGPEANYPLSFPSTYALPDATTDRHAQMREETGLSRAILVQPAPYGDDCRAMIDAIAGSSGTLRGIGTAFDGASREYLAELRQAGIVGLRFVHLNLPGGQNRFPGAAGFDDLRSLAPAMRDIGLHAQLWCDAAIFAEHQRELDDLGLTIVLEHMGRFDIAEGVDGAAFSTILSALSKGDVWVKLALCRASQQFPDYADLRPFHDALIAANSKRVLWASDWPHVRLEETRPDVGHLLDIFSDWTGRDAALARQILVDNPAELYGFPPLA
jgi:2-pyrone-4,6-dicarboxylate lactonase